jgi:hypothetical protein
VYEIEYWNGLLCVSYNGNAVAVIELKLPLKGHFIRIRENEIEVRICYDNPLGDPIWQTHVYTREWHKTEEPADLERSNFDKAASDLLSKGNFLS